MIQNEIEHPQSNQPDPSLGAVLDQLPTDEEMDSLSKQNSNDFIARFYKDIRKYRLLTPEEIQNLCTRFQENGDIEARDLAVTHNLRLVLHTARMYRGRGVDFLDLVQEGTIGLFRAVQKYKFKDHNAAFATYAFYWIRQAMTRAIENQKATIRIPTHIQILWQNINKYRWELRQELGRKPSLQEIANKTGLSILKIRKIFCQMSERTLSLNDYLPYQDGKISIADSLPDQTFLTPEQFETATDEFEQTKIRLQNMLISLECFSERDQNIFALRFGLDGSLEKKTLDEIGKRFGVTREGIRQIVLKLCRKLQSKGMIKGPECVEIEVEKIKLFIDIIGRTDTGRLL
jgi:RNA polymerase primary sigma factor